MNVIWARIEEFPSYSVSNFGDVVNEQTGKLLHRSLTHQGAVKVNLIKDGLQRSRSVKVLVANAFVDKPPFAHRYEMQPFDTPILLDGDQMNVCAANIVWRPRWFAWKYARQFSVITTHHDRGPIRDVETRQMYYTFMEAAMVNGILVKDILSSILGRPPQPTFPTWQIFEFIR